MDHGLFTTADGSVESSPTGGVALERSVTSLEVEAAAFRDNCAHERLSPVPSCIILYHHVSSCTILYQSVPSCTILYHHVPSCTNLYHPVPSCIILYHPVSCSPHGPVPVRGTRVLGC